MNRQPLPLIDARRTEFGFVRTVCSCTECTLNCQYLPGYLIPADLERVKRHLAVDQNFAPWTMAHLLASPGAKVLHAGKMFRIPTIVPARRPDGACTFLKADERCAIHAVSPFGCAFFDSLMPPEEADRRSSRGLRAVLDAWIRRDLYAQVWNALHQVGLLAPPPEIARLALGQARDRDRPKLGS